MSDRSSLRDTASGSREAFVHACENGDLSQVRLRHSQGMPVDFSIQGSIFCRRERQTCQVTPLLAAVSGGHEEVADFLLDVGADPRAPRDGHYTPASWVLVHGSDRALEWLLAKYPDPTEYLPEGESIGGLTASFTHRILALRARGLGVLAASRNGRSVLEQASIFYASEDGRLETAFATLVALGADTVGSEYGLSHMLGVHFRNRLYAAVLLSDPELTRIALEDGADPKEVLQPGGVSILQRIEGDEGDGTLWPYRQTQAADTQACAAVIRAHIARAGDSHQDRGG